MNRPIRRETIINLFWKAYFGLAIISTMVYFFHHSPPDEIEFLIFISSILICFGLFKYCWNKPVSHRPFWKIVFIFSILVSIIEMIYFPVPDEIKSFFPMGGIALFFLHLICIAINLPAFYVLYALGFQASRGQLPQENSGPLQDMKQFILPDRQSAKELQRTAKISGIFFFSLAILVFISGVFFTKFHFGAIAHFGFYGFVFFKMEKDVMPVVIPYITITMLFKIMNCIISGPIVGILISVLIIFFAFRGSNAISKFSANRETDL